MVRSLALIRASRAGSRAFRRERWRYAADLRVIAGQVARGPEHTLAAYEGRSIRAADYIGARSGCDQGLVLVSAPWKRIVWHHRLSPPARSSRIAAASKIIDAAEGCRLFRRRLHRWPNCAPCAARERIPRSRPEMHVLTALSGCRPLPRREAVRAKEGGNRTDRIAALFPKSSSRPFPVAGFGDRLSTCCCVSCRTLGIPRCARPGVFIPSSKSARSSASHSASDFKTGQLAARPSAARRTEPAMRYAEMK